ncbi:uncharacterized protein [Paramisgurnus dabryanus]|uniref:uncharacterized protein n=1 Tax=Paramisgurnus dabryanus TaxID=90735 RepID=UPI003CCF41B4
MAFHLVRRVMNSVFYVIHRMAFLFNMVKGNKYYVIQPGNLCGANHGIIKSLRKCVPSLTEVKKVDECDMILVFCPIVSRAGTDIDAALYQLNNCSESKPAVFMVLHHTFDREKVLPDSSSFITRGNTLTVNFLFHEDVGLLECNMNKAAQAKIIQYLNRQIQFKKTFKAIMLFIAVTPFLYYFLWSPKIDVYEFRGLSDQTSKGAENAS